MIIGEKQERLSFHNHLRGIIDSRDSSSLFPFVMDLKECELPFKPFSLHIAYKQLHQIEAIIPHHFSLLLHNEQLPRNYSNSK